jgi:hypothetical protein
LFVLSFVLKRLSWLPPCMTYIINYYGCHT